MKNNFFAFIILASVLSGCATKSIRPVSDVPPARVVDEQRRGELKAAYQAIVFDPKLPAIESGKQYQRVRIILARLRIAAGFSPDGLPFRVINAPTVVNAAAYKDSVILVFSGLLEKVPEDSKLAVVLAHEVGHILAQHSREDDSKGREQSVGTFSRILGTVVSVGLAAGGYGGLSESAGKLTSDTSAKIGYGAYVRKFDRLQEYEADQIGMMLLARAGYSPREAIAFWSNAEAVFGSSAGSSFFSTHPHAEDRVTRLQKILPVAEAEARRFKDAGRK